MSDRQDGAAPASQPNDGDDAEEASREERLGRSREKDPFAAAFKKAEKQLDGGKKPSKSEDDDDEEDGKPARRQPKKQASRPADDEADEDADDEDDDGEDEKPAKRRETEAAKQPRDEKKPAVKSKEAEADGRETLKAKDWWSHDKRNSFGYQPKHVQQAWLEEAPAPPGHWPTEMKDNFGKMPREAQEAWLSQSQTLERGFSDKFQALAAERKIAETIRSIPSPEQRQFMQQRGLDEVKTFAALMKAQEASTKDPVGYVRDFIMRNKIDPRHILGSEGGAGGDGAGSPAPQADIRSHPVVQALQAEVSAMKAAQMEEARRRDKESDRRIETEMSGVLAEKDEGGDPAYPYVRVLASTMAQILSADPEKYDSMGTRDRFVTAYQIALEQFPELQSHRKAAKPAPADEQDDEDRADPEEDEDDAKLKRAATKKSSRPKPASHDRGDPFTTAFNKAQKQLGQR